MTPTFRTPFPLILPALAWLAVSCSREPEVRVVTEEVIKEKIVEKIVIEKPPLPASAVDYRDTPDDLVKLYNGFQIKTHLELSEGESAVIERKRKDAYEIEFTVNIRVPEASLTMEQLAAINEHLPRMLPGLEPMLPAAKASGFYHELYQRKSRRVQQYLTRLRRVPSRHNYYDCETILELTHPQSAQRVLLLQGDMDVVSDGSDGDRMPELDEYIANSQYYQYATSYGWKKQTSQPNPLLPRWEEKLAKATGSEAAQLRREIADMKARSYLIARKDPFMVIPTSFLGYQKKTPFGPTMGDYCVVIHEDKIYPAIIGDAGPTYKIGEASLRLAQTIDEKASPYRRPVSELTVTYLVFPQSRDPHSPPNLEHWRSRCLGYLEKIGGLGIGYQLHEWEDLFKEKEGPEATMKPADPEEA